MGVLYTTAMRRSADVDVVWLWLERIPEEHDEVDAAFGDRRTELLVATQRAAEVAVDVQFVLAVVMGDHHDPFPRTHGLPNVFCLMDTQSSGPSDSNTSANAKRSASIIS